MQQGRDPAVRINGDTKRKKGRVCLFACNENNAACIKRTPRATLYLRLPRFPGLAIDPEDGRKGGKVSKARLHRREGSGRDSGKGSHTKGVRCDKRQFVTEQGRESYDTYLEYHTAQLCSEQQLLPLRDQGIDHEVLLHICDNATLVQSSVIQPPMRPMTLCITMTAKQRSQMTPAHLHL